MGNQRLELLYVWINQTVPDVFRQQGINFSPEFKFVMEQQGDKWKLSEDENWEKRESIFRTNVVENVSVVIGKNGTGKTTLLKHLLHLSGVMLPIREWDGGDNSEIRKKSLCVMIYRIDDNVVVYHNFERKNFISGVDYEVRNCNESFGENIKKRFY